MKGESGLIQEDLKQRAPDIRRRDRDHVTPRLARCGGQVVGTGPRHGHGRLVAPTARPGRADAQVSANFDVLGPTIAVRLDAFAREIRRPHGMGWRMTDVVIEVTSAGARVSGRGRRHDEVVGDEGERKEQPDEPPSPRTG